MKTSAVAVALGVGLLGVLAWAAYPDKGVSTVDKKADNRVFEIRTYFAEPGKMKALHERFRNHTCKLFEKHGMTIIGFWSPIDEKDAAEKMVYILAFPSKEAADRSWKAFREDPDWKKAKEASEKDGSLVKKVVSEYLNAMDYSPIK